MTGELKYKYQATWGRLIFGNLLVIVLVIFFTYLALTNEVGLILNGIEFSARGATIFYSILAVFMFLVEIIFLMVSYRKFKGPNEIVITKESISVPPPLFRTNQPIFFNEITELKEQNVQGNLMFTIKSLKGNRFLMQNMLPSKEDYSTIKSILYQEVEGGKSEAV